MQNLCADMPRFRRPGHIYSLTTEQLCVNLETTTVQLCMNYEKTTVILQMVTTVFYTIFTITFTT